MDVHSKESVVYMEKRKTRRYLEDRDQLALEIEDLTGFSLEELRDRLVQGGDIIPKSSFIQSQDIEDMSEALYRIQDEN